MADHTLRGFLEQQVTDFLAADLAERSPLLKDFTFYHNKEVDDPYEWAYFALLWTPSMFYGNGGMAS